MTEIGRVDSTFEGPKLSSDELAILFGVTTEAVRSMPVADGKIKIPPTWIRAGRLRCARYKTQTGRDDMQGAIAWLRTQDLAS